MDQADRLRAIASRSMGSRATRVISVTSGKGGVGKTNIAVNLAISFSRKGLKTLLIDGDLGLANANILIGCEIGKTIDDVMFANASMESVFVRTGAGFDLLPGSSGFRKMLALDNFAQRHLFDEMFKFMQNYDIVIYDTAPGIGEHVLSFNSAAHDIVVVAHPEPAALTDAYALIKVMSQERREKRFKLLVNRARLPEEGLDAFKRLIGVTEEFLNISVDYLGSIPEDLAVLRSARIQRPVSVDAPRSPFALAIERIGDKLLAGSLTEPAKRLWDTKLANGSRGA